MVDKKQKNIKNIIFKIIHVIGYFCIGLCAFAFIVVGVQSCKNNNEQKQVDKPVNNVVNPSTDIYSYTIDNLRTDFKYQSIRLPYAVSNIYSISSGGVGECYVEVTTVNNQTYSFDYFYFHSSGAYFKNTSGTNATYPYTWFSNGNNIAFMEYKTGTSTPSITNDRLINKITFLYLNETRYNQFISYFGYSADSLNSSYDEGYEEGYSIGYNEGLSNGGSVVNTFTDKIIINYDFDWRYLLGSAIDDSTGLVYNSNDLSSYGNIIDLSGLTFECNNVTYNTIRLTFMQMGNVPVVCGDSVFTSNSSYQTYSKNTSDLFGSDYPYYYSLISVLYLNIDNNDNITNAVTVFEGYEVTTTNIMVGTGTINTGFDYRKPHWTNQTFRKLNIINDNNLKVNVPSFGNTFTTLELISEGGVVATYNVSTLDIFSLLEGAFTSVSGIFAISILPNITIGILFFLPLVVTLVVVIIRIIKKG